MDQLAELSGLAASRTTAGWWWAVNDGPGTTGVAVLGDRGLLGEVRLAGMEGRDVEDLAVAPCGTAPGWCLYVADVGDNRRRRDQIVVWRVAEPNLSQGLPTQALDPERVVLRHPDHAEDVEALLVDEAGLVHLVTKPRATGGEAPPGRLLVAPDTDGGVLVDAGALALPPPVVGLLGSVVGDVVTGGSARRDAVLLRTYDAVYELLAPSPGAALASLARWPVREVPGPALPQGEAVAWAADGCGYATASEGLGELWTVPRSPCAGA